ncbi:hypothetical protein HK413_07290 [Mucilaginibacter sp. S1162]|uniref:Uncharacterized protein n=1 Tax=Mucilaginibacter humi TaxID=2732510 RepID=A0ABX1W411_9SPHI|nr:hypothetical protein [Mucilaginibacter humi]
MAQPVKLDCCKKQTKACKRTPEPKDDCAAGNCSMLLTCGICGFLTVDPVNVKPALVINIASPVTIYKMGNVPGYSSSDWKPPKV